MKNHALLFISTIAIFSASTAFAQKKIDIDKFKRKMEFIGVPKSKTLSDFNTYSITFNAKQETLNKLELRPKTIEDFFHLEGYSFVKEGNGDFIYSIQIGEPSITKEQVVESIVEVKNADGTKTKSTLYSAIIEMSAPTIIQLINNENGAILHVAVFSTQDNPTVFKSEPSTKEGAEKVISFKTAGLNMSVKKNYIDALNAEIRKIKNAYSFEKQSYEQEFMDVDVKKSPDLQSLHNEITKVSSALSSAPYSEPLQKVQLALEPVLSSWLASAEKLSSADKYEQKLKFVYLFNLAVSQLWLEQFDDALSTAEKITQNDYKTYEAGIIKENVNMVKEYLAKNGYRSRHFYRKGFYSTYNYTYTKQAIDTKPWNPIAQTAKDIKELEDIAKGTAKQLVEELTLGDTILSSTAFYSTFKFMLDGVPYDFKKASLSLGSGEASAGKSYKIYCYTKEGLIVKQGQFSGMTIQLYAKDTNNLTAKNIQTLFTKYKGQTIGDISTPFWLDSVPFKVNGQKMAPKLISWELYGKNLAADIEFSFHTQNGDDFYSYKTMNGDQFQIELVSATPIVVQGNGKSCSQGYMAKFKIPSVRVTRFWYGHYSPMYTEEYKEFKDVEFYILLK
ncbi:MAG: hypothetical protein NT150_15145 [Bacteroidetes bacterium]|nr:hypothetical protein [Bacteroidota bacterium]